jgi:hypothetical protein
MTADAMRTGAKMIECRFRDGGGHASGHYVVVDAIALNQAR